MIVNNWKSEDQQGSKRRWISLQKWGWKIFNLLVTPEEDVSRSSMTPRTILWPPWMSMYKISGQSSRCRIFQSGGKCSIHQLSPTAIAVSMQEEIIQKFGIFSTEALENALRCLYNMAPSLLNVCLCHIKISVKSIIVLPFLSEQWHKNVFLQKGLITVNWIVRILDTKWILNKCKSHSDPY